MRAYRASMAQADVEERRSDRAKVAGVVERIRDADRERGRRDAEMAGRRSRARDVYGAIGFDRMFRDGLCEVEEGLYSETMEFEDMSYQSLREEDQMAVFAAMSQLLDYFDPGTWVQLSVTNTPIPEEEVGRRTFFPEDGENRCLAEQYNRILNAKMREGCSNIQRHRYITYGTRAPSPDAASSALGRMRASVRQTLTRVKSHGHVLDGLERLAVVNGVTRPGTVLDFDYDRDLSARSPLTAKDWVCPTSLDFRPDGADSSLYRAGDAWCRVLVMRESLAAEMRDTCISDVLDLPVPMTITWHLTPIDKARAVAMAKRQAAWIQKEVIDNQRRALRQGYDYTILPPELEDTRNENEKVLDLLLHRNQRLYYFTGLVFTWADSREALEEQTDQIVRTCHQEGIELAPLNLRQREGMNSVLPLAANRVDVSRDLTTGEAAIFVPFTTQEIDQEGGGYYGQNAQSANLVLCNRKRLMSPHGFICGMSGSGKSFAVKREIENTILGHESDQVYVMDVTGEYSYLVESNGGKELAYGPDSNVYSNPLDMDDASDMSWQAAMAWKIDAILAMTSALKAEGEQGLTQEERSVVTRCVEDAYRSYEEEGRVPLLEDLVASLRSVEEGRGREEAARLALIFDRYVSGPFGFLNHQSNVDLGRERVVSFMTRDVPSDMRVITMLANLETVRMQMYRNHERGVATWLYIDEVQSLFGHPAIIRYLARLWREGRKYGLICTGMTQSAAAMSGDPEASAIIDQSGFLLLLRQSDADRHFWVEARGLSGDEEKAIGETARPGEGLLIADAARVPITDDFPSGNDLYDMFNTSPEEHARIKAKRRRGRGRG